MNPHLSLIVGVLIVLNLAWFRSFAEWLIGHHGKPQCLTTDLIESIIREAHKRWLSHGLKERFG